MAQRIPQRLEQNRPPPADYYADNVRLLIETVLEQYSDILTDNEQLIANAILCLSRNASRLFARMLTRSKSLMLSQSLNYAEVDNRNRALDELEAAGLVVREHEIPADRILALLTVPTLRKIYRNVSHVTPKHVYIDHLACRYTESRHRLMLKGHCSWVELSAESELRLFGLLFFGDLRQDFSAFVVRDLGIVRYESYVIDERSRQFRDRAKLDRYLDLIALNQLIHETADAIDEESALRVVEKIQHPEDSRLLERLRARILNRLGRGLERQDANRVALMSYAASSLHPARERSMRIFSKMKRDECLESVRQRVLSDPWSEEERLFAYRFRRPNLDDNEVSVTVETLREQPLQQGIEEYAIDWLTRNGGTAWHLENSLPMSLFGLAFWDWIFAPVDGVFINPFQAAPKDLFWPEFFEVRSNLVRDPLERVQKLKSKIRSTACAKRGIANALVNWQVMDDVRLQRILDVFSVDAIERILSIVRADLSQMRSGFPDLTVINDDGSFEFVEVKGPNDQLQQNQKIWLKELAVNELPSRVLRFNAS